MAAESPVTVVQIWHDALNEGNVERLMERVTSEVEVAGPRGSGRGADLVRDWVTRAGIRMVPTQWFARGDQVVVQEETAWTMPDGTLSEPRLLAAAFQVVGDRVARIARYSDLEAALNATGVQPTDIVDVEGAPPRE